LFGEGGKEMVRSFCVCLSLFVISQAAADDAAKEKEKLKGLWQAVSMEANGQQAPADQVKRFQVRFKGDRVVFSPEADNREHTFEVDPSAKPKAMDLIPGDGQAKGKKLAIAIYKFDGDKLIICIDKEAQTGKRPTQFETAGSDGLVLITLDRVKTIK
jgi:uncharacterized protein (TIGR03067 family)